MADMENRPKDMAETVKDEIMQPEAGAKEISEKTETGPEGEDSYEKDISDQTGSDAAEEEKAKKKKKPSVHMVIECLLAAGLVTFAGLFGSTNARTGKTIDELNSQIEELKNDKSKLNEEKKDLNSQIEDLNAKIDQQNAKIDELENGASAQLVEIKNNYEAQKWKDVVSGAKALHEKYNGSAEDKEAQQLASAAQQKLDEAAAAAEAEKAKGYETGITYDQLARTPDDYSGKKCKFRGEVVQVIEGDSDVQIRLAVNDDYDSIIFCQYDKSIVKSRVLENDHITVYGTSMGTISYESTMGGTITIPAMVVDKMDQ